MSPSRGVTLFESCLILILMSALALTAVPSMTRARQAYGLRAAAYQVQTELHRTRILAVVRNEDCRLRVTSAVTYLVECQAPTWTPVQYHQLPRGFRITANASPEFHPLGHVGPMATISVWNDAGGTARIVVNRTGRIRIE